MSAYPKWWNTTITVFTKYENPSTNLVTWYKHIIPDCFWKDVGNKVTVGNVSLETNNIVCRIPAQEDFLEKYEWVAFSSDDKPNYLAIGIGDLVFKGVVDDDINEYSSGYRSTDLISKYKNLMGCMNVKQVTISTGFGVNNPHYHIIGN